MQAQTLNDGDAEAITKPTTVAGMKRLAKKIKKASEGNITHIQALEIVARDNNFKNWAHLLNALPGDSK